MSDTTVMAIRMSQDTRNRIEEFSEENGYEQPSQAVRVLLEMGLSQAEGSELNLENLSAIQQNASSEAISLMYGILGEVVKKFGQHAQSAR